MTLLRVEQSAAALFLAHPPQVAHGGKRLILAQAAPPGAAHHGDVVVTRHRPRELPEVPLPDHGAVEERVGLFDYGPTERGVMAWHLNFADPHVFFGYGGALFAQDEIQVAEHPILGSVREALEAEHPAHTMTVEAGQPTPILVRGAERRVAIDTREIYGQRFARATPETLRSALRLIEPPTISNILAIAAPSGGRGRYRSLEIELILRTAYTGFRAAKDESGGARVQIHTGFWGCGVFGGNRRLLPLLQLAAARWAGVDRLIFHSVDAAGSRCFEEAQAQLRALGAARPAELVARLTALGYEWGQGDGN